MTRALQDTSQISRQISPQISLRISLRISPRISLQNLRLHDALLRASGTRRSVLTTATDTSTVFGPSGMNRFSSAVAQVATVVASRSARLDGPGLIGALLCANAEVGPKAGTGAMRPKAPDGTKMTRARVSTVFLQAWLCEPACMSHNPHRHCFLKHSPTSRARVGQRSLTAVKGMRVSDEE